jgi:hypothetical protein
VAWLFIFSALAFGLAPTIFSELTGVGGEYVPLFERFPNWLPCIVLSAACFLCTIAVICLYDDTNEIPTAFTTQDEEASATLAPPVAHTAAAKNTSGSMSFSMGWNETELTAT